MGLHRILALASLASIASASAFACGGDDAASPAAGDAGASNDASLHADSIAPGSDSGAPDAAPDTQADAGRSLVLSFAVVGCNRIDPADYAAVDASASVPPSTANIAQLTRTFDEIAAMSPKPKYFFAAGDIIMGYVNNQGDAGVAALDAELSAWLALYNASSLKAAGITLVPIPGNHEVQSKIGSAKTAFAAAESIWLTRMGSFIPSGIKNGPPAGTPLLGADASADAATLATDQSQLTYSFDDGATHFVIVDTDPVGEDFNVPSAWVAQDIATAKAGGAKHVFAIGHKPAFSYPTVALDGLSTGITRDAFWSALESGNAEAMIAAHNHVWWWVQPNAGKTFQIVAGNGGSKLEATVLTPPAGGPPPNTGKYYGFTVVNVWSDDAVTIDSYGRELPSGNYFDPAPSATYPTTLRTTVKASWGTTHQ
jgi:hypothetical protein